MVVINYHKMALYHPAGGSSKETLENWLPAETDVAVALVVCLELSRASAVFVRVCCRERGRPAQKLCQGDTSQ